jgi:phosphoribosyl 1,2-cyclic phosphodiesterase
MRFAALGSGSRGNAWLVEAGATRILVDCGFGPRELDRRLGRLGLVCADLAAILVTHEHSDHVAGVARCVARHGVAVHATHGTLVASGLADIEHVRPFVAGACFAVGELEIQSFAVPHDAREPAQFVLADGARRLGLLTDAGHVTARMIEALDGADALVLEANHDAQMLADGRYPWPLKRRIAGRLGHLDNAAAAGLLMQIDHHRLQHVVAAHLSETNNTPLLAQTALAGALSCAASEIAVANQRQGLDWRSLW